VTTAFGYCRVSTDRQGERGYGLADQREKIVADVAYRHWDMGEIFVDVASGKSMRRRPELEKMLKALDAGEADVLVISKLDRLSRSLLDFARLMERGQNNGWSIVALDLGIDTSTINGELLANIIMALAQWERRMIASRTKAALAVAKSQGKVLGRPSGVSEETATFIRVLRQEGRSYRHISGLLNERAEPTSQAGKQWYASTVRAVEKSLGV